MEKEERLKQVRKKEQAEKQDRVCFPPTTFQYKYWPPHQKREEAKIAQERKDKKWQKDHAYDDIFNEDDMEASSNQNRGEDFLDDFM